MIAQITPTDLPQWLQAQTAPVVLDVREPGEWQAASVQADGFTAGSTSVPALFGRIGSNGTI